MVVEELGQLRPVVAARKEGFDFTDESYEMIVITNLRQNHKSFVPPGCF